MGEKMTTKQKIIIAKYQQGLSTNKIARLLNTSSSYPYWVLKKYNITLRRIRDYAGRSKYDFDRNFFQKIDNPIKAYWLGVLIADGYIDGKYKVRLSISRQDEDWLKLFKKDLKSKNLPLQTGIILPIRYSSSHKENDIVYIQINYCKMVEHLKKWGCIQNKTGKEIFPKIPKKFYPDFIRGIFDGDGSAGFYKDKKNSWQPHFRLCGSKNLLERIREILMKECNVNNNKIKKRNGVFVLAFVGFRQVKRIYEFIYYKEDVRCLLRKKKIFDDAFMLYNKKFNKIWNGENWVKENKNDLLWY